MRLLNKPFFTPCAGKKYGHDGIKKIMIVAVSYCCE